MNVDNVNFFLKSTLVKTSFDIDDDHIKAVERIIRDSLEYRKFIADQRENQHQNHCDLLTEFTFTNKKTKLELHHVIFLYSLVKAAYEKLLKENPEKFITTYDVANMVMEWHYKNAIPYIFLSQSAHQLYHDGQYSIQDEHILGDAKLAKSIYYEYLEEADKEILDRMLKNA